LAEALRNYAFVTDTSANEVIKVALAEYLTAHAHTDIVGAAFNKALKQHAIAFDKLANLWRPVDGRRLIGIAAG